MVMRVGHSPMFPAYRYTKNRQRQIAMLYRNREGTWTIQGRTEKHTLDSSGDVCEFIRYVATQCSYDVYVTSFDREYCPWFNDFLAQEWCYAPLTASNSIGISVTALRFKAYTHNIHKVRVLNIVPISKWNLGIINSASALPYILLLTKLFRLMKCGVQSTPGGQGMAYMHQQWTKLGYKPISNVPRMLQLMLEKYQIGGRVDTPGIGRMYQDGYEYDLCSAYPSAACSLPSGPVTYFGSTEPGEEDARIVYYAECTVTCHEELLNSPVGVWNEERKAHQWRLEQGIHIVGLWSTEIAMLRLCGVECVVERCYAWMEAFIGMTPLMRQYERWIAYAEKHVQEDLIVLLKLCRLAGLGRWGMRPEKKQVITESEALPTDVPFLLDRHDSEAESIYYLRTSYDKKRFYGIHLWCYMQTDVRLQLWNRTQLEAQLGNELIATNFDSYTVTERSRLPYVVARSGGQWRERKLSSIYIPYPRAVVSKEKVRLPGTPYTARQEMLAWHEKENMLQKCVAGTTGG